MNPQVDQYIREANLWQAEMVLLRDIFLNAGLDEEFKWKQPCYSYRGKNILIIGPFKHFCALLFFKGALLSDEMGVLSKPAEHTRSERQIRLNSSAEIQQLEGTIKAYIQEAILVEEMGLKVEKPKEIVVEELNEAFEKDAEFRKAFEALTPGRQRGYRINFSEAKQSKTRVARIAKNKNRILDGFGMQDCTCGLSKKMPSCDGSHRELKS